MREDIAGFSASTGGRKLTYRDGCFVAHNHSLSGEQSP